METLRGTVQPLTRSLPAPIRDFGISLIGPECYQSLILDIDLTSTQCLRLALSKALGIATVVGSSVVKVPQILKLLSSQSGAGISFLSYALETSAMMTTLAYSARNGFPFNTYGETAMIAAQNVVISLLVLRYTGQTALAAVFVAALASGGYSLFNEGVVDMQMLTYAQMGAGVLGVVSKLPQVWTIYSEGGTGQLSAFMVFNYLFGSLTRIYTTLQEVDDKLILSGFVGGFVLNVVLAAQMVGVYESGRQKKDVTREKAKTTDNEQMYYWNSPATAPHAAEMGQKPANMAMGSSTGASSKGKGPTTRRRG